MGELSDFQVGQTVELQDGQTATVQFVGQTHFAAGDWIGVVLETASGKNDGSVQGQRYFDCQPAHGMFVRPTVPKILDQPTPKANGRIQTKTNGEAARNRQSMAVAGLRRQSVVDPAVAKRQSISTGSPTPAPGVPQMGRTTRSPAKSPTKQSASTTSSGISTPRSTTSATKPKPPITGSRGTRPSMGPPSGHSSTIRPPRQSVAGAMNGSARLPSIASASSRTSSKPFSMRPDTKPLSSIDGEGQASAGSGYESLADSLDNEALSPPATDVVEEAPPNGINPLRSQDSLNSSEEHLIKPTSLRGRSPPYRPQKPLAANSAASRENEDLKTKLRVMEKKRMEDREKLKALERVQGERDKFEGIVQKLQSKYQPQQQEIADLRKQLKDTDAKVEALEKQQAANDTVVEVATLDREMAEETAETLRGELDSLKTSHEELRLEVEVLREENQELGKEMSPEEKTSQGWLQMERSNERLREALMRLRDVTQEQEADLREQVAELERDLHDHRGAKERQMQTEAALTESELTIEELRQQLETALGAEDMIEELTEKNLALNEQVQYLKAAVEELESLKELNDELEINHTENAKQMQQEIDNNESLLAEQARNAATQDQTIQDLEYTVTRFRNLVTSMQTDLEEMRASQQLTEAEANDLSSRSKAMMDLNLRLQTTATKAQIKAIDLELGKLKAEESAEHLSIVQLFLPESFRRERNSIRAYLRFKRIKFKADLLHDYVKDKATTQSHPITGDDMFISCEVMDKLLFVSSTCDRFIKSIQSCDLAAFARLESAWFDLEPVERAFNNWIEAMRRDELKEEPCSTELSGTIALITHLAEVHINDNLERYADDIHSRALVMQGQLESALMALTHVKTAAEAKVIPSSPEEGEEGLLEFNRKADSVISQMRSAKVMAGKTIRQLEEMQSRSLTLNQSALANIDHWQASLLDLSNSIRAFGCSISKLLNEENQASTLSGQNLSAALSATDISLPSLAIKAQNATSYLQSFYNLSANLNNTIEFPQSSQLPPWQLLARKLASETITSASHEIEISRLTDEARDRSTTLALRDKSIEELSVKLETLEKRASESDGRRERVRELEKIMEAAKQRETDLVDMVNRLRSERNDLRAQRESWASKSGGTATPADVPASSVGVTSEASLGRISALESEIKTLQAAIRHLRSTSYAHTISSAHDFLSKPLIPQASPQEQRDNLKRSEAKSVVNELLRLATDPVNGVVKLRERKKEERLGWRPVRETCWWQVERAKEEWEEWKEWRDGFAAKRKPRKGADHVSGNGVAAAVPIVGTTGFGKDAGGDVKIMGDDESQIEVH
ncbi:MAG: hypothetical protein Q9201_005490 [Fulgogasparrea decipioides]